ncbi:MAG: Zn-dependent exopeptidase M28 [Ruminococcaceae bacterium]|nr:Zn-dependent exopeptidase M28 [Oscillospiraceae bacterium]
MTLSELKKLLKKLSFIRPGGTDEEHRAAKEIKKLCEAMGSEVKEERFPITVPENSTASITFGSGSIDCEPYFDFGNGTVTGELYILHKRSDDYYKGCKDKIVLLDGAISRSTYEKLYENGAKAFISFFGSVNERTKDIFSRRRRFIWDKELMPAVCIHAKDAARLCTYRGKTVTLSNEFQAKASYGINLTTEVKGEIDEEVIVCAHYDSTSNSKGVFDNLSGTLALIHILEELKEEKPFRGLRLLWTSCEELGLVGAHHYCKEHKCELGKTALCINLDMLGAAIGSFTSFSSVNEDTQGLLTDFAKNHSFPNESRLGIRSSDSTVFTSHSVPTVSFARYAPTGIATVHTVRDKLDAVDPATLLNDMEYVSSFTRFALSKDFPKQGEIDEKIKEDTEKYFLNKIMP